MNEGESFETDRSEPDYFLRPCGHEWRNNDFTCMDCVEGRVTVMERELSLARSALERIAELEGDCENQKFNLTRFQAAQLARRFIASAATDCVANSPETADATGAAKDISDDAPQPCTACGAKPIGNIPGMPGWFLVEHESTCAWAQTFPPFKQWIKGETQKQIDVAIDNLQKPQRNS